MFLSSSLPQNFPLCSLLELTLGQFWGAGCVHWPDLPGGVVHCIQVARANPAPQPAPMATVMDGDLTGLTGTILQIGR